MLGKPHWLESWRYHGYELAGLVLEEVNILDQLLVHHDRELYLQTMGEGIDEGIFVSKILSVVEMNGSLHLPVEYEIEFEFFPDVL